jgi:hypothetical protein
MSMGVDTAQPALEGFQVAPWQAEPHRLWSLLDMLRFYSGEFLQLKSALQAAEHALTTDPGDSGVLALLTALHAIGPTLTRLPVSGTVREQAMRLEAQVRTKWVTDPEAMRLLVSELQMNLLHDLEIHVFLCIPHLQRSLYEEPEKWFGQQVVDGFPDARRALRDAGRCLALDQWTAAVFHAMRILEHGLRAFASRVGLTLAVPMELENWKNIIDQIEKEIRKQEALPKSAAKSAELQFCANAAAHFWYIKEAWRNHVSHSRADYDEDEAARVVEHVRDFMRALA